MRTEIPEAPSPVPIPLPLNVHNVLAQHTSPSQAQHPNVSNAPDRNNLGLARGNQATRQRKHYAQLNNRDIYVMFQTHVQVR